MSGIIFAEPWWLEAVAAGHWGEVVVDRDGRRQAELRYTLWRERLGFVRLGVGPLSPRVEPRLLVESAKAPTRLARENELVAGLIGRLPRYDYLSFMLPPEIQNWLPFHWLGFQETTRYSYVVDDPSNEERTWSDMEDKTRNVIRKAQRQLEVVDGDAETLMRLARATFGRGKIRMRYGEAQLVAGVRAGRSRDRAAVRIAVDKDGRPHAGALFVWDDTRVYYLVGGNAPELRSSGASALVLWDGIQLAGRLGLRFDFEGSMIAPIERFFRGFGGRPEPYLHITHTSRRLALALAGRDSLAAIAGRRPGDRTSKREHPNGPEGPMGS